MPGPVPRSACTWPGSFSLSLWLQKSGPQQKPLGGARRPRTRVRTPSQAKQTTPPHFHVASQPRPSPGGPNHHRDIIQARASLGRPIQAVTPARLPDSRQTSDGAIPLLRRYSIPTIPLRSYIDAALNAHQTAADCLLARLRPASTSHDARQ